MYVKQFITRRKNLQNSGFLPTHSLTANQVQNKVQNIQ